MLVLAAAAFSAAAGAQELKPWTGGAAPALVLDDLEGRPFEVLAVNLAELHSRIRAYLEKMPVGFKVLVDRDTAAAMAWKARILPATYIVGADGRIRYAYVGELDWSQESVRRAIAGLLPH